MCKPRCFNAKHHCFSDVAPLQSGIYQAEPKGRRCQEINTFLSDRESLSEEVLRPLHVSALFTKMSQRREDRSLGSIIANRLGNSESLLVHSNYLTTPPTPPHKSPEIVESCSCSPLIAELFSKAELTLA